jgi:environmental stress-induced protein Ves
MDFYPCNVGVFCFTPCKKKKNYAPCNVDNVLHPYADFFADVPWKISLSRQQKSDFADVTVTFSLQHKQKSQQRGMQKFCQHCKGNSQFFFCRR